MADAAFYTAIPNHRTGFDGDVKTRRWLAESLANAGARVSLDAFEVDSFDLRDAALFIADRKLDGFVPWPVAAADLATPLVHYRPPGPDPQLAGMIAVIRLPYVGSGASQMPRLRALVDIGAASGARAILAITEGPTGEVIALNAAKKLARWPVPVLLIGERHAAAIDGAAKAGTSCRLLIAGAPARRPTANIIGHFGPPTGPATIVTTPMTGWFACGGERGTGIALFLHLARAIHAGKRRFIFAALAGHELDDQGATRFLSAAPLPAETRLWLRMGAGMAARSWHIARGDLRPLPSADDQRRIVTDPATAPVIERLFANQPGLERPYAVTSGFGLEGDVAAMIGRGYARHVSFYGWHALHHTPIDDLQTTDEHLLTPVAAALNRLIQGSN